MTRQSDRQGYRQPISGVATLAWVLSGAVSPESPVWAGEEASAIQVIRSDASLQIHPKKLEGLFIVPRDIEEGGHLRISYWRVAEKQPNRGVVSATFEIWRDLDQDGTFDDIESRRIKGKIRDQSYDKTIGPLNPLRTGDLILFFARFKKMPKIEPYRRATFEASLLNSGAPCPDSSGLEGDVIPPTPILRPAPHYTEDARQEGIQGAVILEGVLSCNGRVTHIRVLETQPLGLEQESVEALSRWRYAPAKREGIPLAVTFSLTINFRLQSAGTEAQSVAVPSVTVDDHFTWPRKTPVPELR